MDSSEYMPGYARRISLATSTAVPIWINSPLWIPGQLLAVSIQLSRCSTSSGQNGNNLHCVGWPDGSNSRSREENDIGNFAAYEAATGDVFEKT
jgi:hypothetical protein